jgi:cytochrome P450
VNNPAIAPSAVNELLRFDAPVQTTSREALGDVQVHGKLIRRGQRVRVLLGSANHDDAHFVEPDKLDLRRDGARLISFGHGIHTCIGAALARLEAQVAFPEIVRRFPGLTLLEKDLQWTKSLSFRGLQRLNVGLGI